MDQNEAEDKQPKLVLDLCATGCDLEPQPLYLDRIIDADVSAVAIACANQEIVWGNPNLDADELFKLFKNPGAKIRSVLPRLHDKYRAPLSELHKNSEGEIPLVALDRAVVIDDFEKILVPTDPGVSLFLSCLRFDFNDAKSQLLLMSAGERKRYMTAALEAAAMSPNFDYKLFEDFFNQVFDDVDIEAAKRRIPFLAPTIVSITNTICMHQTIHKENDEPIAPPRRRSVERA